MKDDRAASYQRTSASLHRVRGRLVAERTALINQLRALMLERGIMPQERRKLERYLTEILADERNGLGPRLRRLIEVAERVHNVVAWRGTNPDQAAKRISKRGNGYLRVLLIHGRARLSPGLAKKDMPLGRWVKALLARAHSNVVPLANKLARIAWTVLARDRRYVAVQTAAS